MLCSETYDDCIKEKKTKTFKGREFGFRFLSKNIKDTPHEVVKQEEFNQASSQNIQFSTESTLSHLNWFISLLSGNYLTHVAITNLLKLGEINKLL